MLLSTIPGDSNACMLVLHKQNETSGLMKVIGKYVASSQASPSFFRIHESDKSWG